MNSWGLFGPHRDEIVNVFKALCMHINANIMLVKDKIISQFHMGSECVGYMSGVCKDPKLQQVIFRLYFLI